MINRRVALKQLAVISAGAMLAPSCMPGKEKTSALYKNVPVTESQEKLLTAIADTLLPKSATPGAVELGIPQFTAKMVDDCLAKKDQEKWLAGLKKFAEGAEKKSGKAFVDLSAAEREKFLIDWEAAKLEDEELKFFYQTTRSSTLYGYTTTEYFMTTVQKYNIIPGPFKGCVPVQNPS
jgi:hypothetical protein